MTHAARAYQTSTTHRSQREQEADVFLHTIGALKLARDAGPIPRLRALADNRRLWVTVNDLMHDPESGLPAELRASIVSVGLAVQREMDRDKPNFEFLIEINRTIAEGLSSAA
jgi:flagellar biosynthesis activator protein FlaF